MTTAIEIAKQCGIAYYLTPENTCEMHGTDRQIESFADAIRAAEREACAKVCEALELVFECQSAQPGYWPDQIAHKCAITIRERSNAGGEAPARLFA